MMGMCLVIVQQKTARTRILEFLRAPFGGTWMGEPGCLTVKQIADGAEVSERYARRILAKLSSSGVVHCSGDRPKLYALEVSP